MFLFCQSEAATPNGPESHLGMEEDPANREEEGSEDEWEQVGPRNKTSITRQADFVRTPITDIFGGHIRYVDGCLHQHDSCDVNSEDYYSVISNKNDYRIISFTLNKRVMTFNAR